jgi:hypothetical protein
MILSLSRGHRQEAWKSHLVWRCVLFGKHRFFKSGTDLSHYKKKKKTFIFQLLLENGIIRNTGSFSHLQMFGRGSAVLLGAHVLSSLS